MKIGENLIHTCHIYIIHCVTPPLNVHVCKCVFASILVLVRASGVHFHSYCLSLSLSVCASWRKFDSNLTHLYCTLCDPSPLWSCAQQVTCWQCVYRSGVILTTGNTHSSLKILLKVKKVHLFQDKVFDWLPIRVYMCAFTSIFLFSGIFFILTKVYRHYKR